MVIQINDKMIGWHFTPTDEILIKILRKWIQGYHFPEFREVRFLNFEPHKLRALAVVELEKSWFFLVRRYMDSEINKAGRGSWRLFDETCIKNNNATVGMKRHYCFYNTIEVPSFWVAYEYRLLSSEISENVQQSHLNYPDKHAVIRLFLNAQPYFESKTAEDHTFVNLLVKRNQGQEFPQFGIVHFFSKEPYQLPEFSRGEIRVYMLRLNDVYSTVDRWATPRGKWKIEDNNTPATCSPVMNEMNTEVVGSKRLRKYYDNENQPTLWNMYEYYTVDHPYVENVEIRDGFFLVVLFKSDSDKSAPVKAPNHIATPQAAGGKSSNGNSSNVGEIGR